MFVFVLYPSRLPNCTLTLLHTKQSSIILQEEDAANEAAGEDTGNVTEEGKEEELEVRRCSYLYYILLVFRIVP